MKKKKNETLTNKIVATILVVLGFASTFIDGDATGLIFVLMIAVPLFFERKNVIDF